jgi:SusD/RagB-like outer membrane lipoprotein
MMNKRVFLSFGAALALSATACDADKVTEANNNPNDPTDAPSSSLFTNAVRNGVGRWQDGVGGTRYGFLPQHLAQVQYPDDDSYLAARLGAAATSGLFNSSYNTELADLKVVIDRGRDASDAGLWAPAEILSQWEFGILTDVFGDVPYSEAFNPDILRPAYDAQPAIYTGIFSALNGASDALATASNRLASGDPIYGGDPAAWRRFANSLRLRHALRLANVGTEAARIGTEVTAAVAAAEGGLILTNAENAKLVWPGDGIYDNPWANNFKTRDDHRISTRLMTFMRNFNDPRVGILAQPAEVVIAQDPARTLNYCPGGGSTCYVGLVNALTQATASPLLPNTSRPGAIFYPGVTAYGTFGGSGGSYPSYLMTAAEVEFLLAEAAERGIGGVTNAASHYINGITRHMEMLGVPAASIATYIAQAGVAYVPGTTGLIQIAQQKWLALFTDPIQAWSEVRRTCQPAIVEPGPGARFAIIPRRLQYSTTDRSVNRANYDVAVSRQWGPSGTDVMTNRIYWDNAAGWAASPTYQLGCSDRSQ